MNWFAEDSPHFRILPTPLPPLRRRLFLLWSAFVAPLWRRLALDGADLE